MKTLIIILATFGSSCLGQTSEKEVWKPVPKTDMYIRTDGLFFPGGFHTYFVTNLPERYIVGEPQSVITEVEGKCGERTFHVLGSVFYAGKNRAGLPQSSLPAEEVIRKVTPDSPFEKAFNMMCSQ